MDDHGGAAELPLGEPQLLGRHRIIDSRLKTPSWLTAALKRLLWPMIQFTA